MKSKSKMFVEWVSDKLQQQQPQQPQQPDAKQMHSFMHLLLFFGSKRCVYNFQEVLGSWQRCQLPHSCLQTTTAATRNNSHNIKDALAYANTKESKQARLTTSLSTIKTHM